MSFTSKTKDEIISLKFNKAEEISFASAIIKNIGIIDKNFRIITENELLARVVYNFLKNNYNKDIKITVRRGYNFHKNYLYILEIDDNVQDIIDDMGLNSGKIKDFLIDDIGLKRAYLAGLFMATGSVNDPGTARYHLEFIINGADYAVNVQYLLNEFNLNSKILKRDNKYMIYVKEAEKISDFLRIISATKSLLYYEDVRVYRENKNLANRLNNCEQANVDKTIMAASEIINDINYLKENDNFDLLDEKIRIVAEYRLKYEEASLQELSEIISSEMQSKITKSGVSHRLNKVKEFASRMRKFDK